MVVLTALVCALALCWSVREVMRRWERVARLRLQGPGAMPTIHTGPIPRDIFEWTRRFPERSSQESEESYVRELYGKLGNWPDVRVAIGLTELES